MWRRVPDSQEGCFASLALGPGAPIACGGLAAADYYVNDAIRQIPFVRESWCNYSYLREIERSAGNC